MSGRGRIKGTKSSNGTERKKVSVQGLSWKHLLQALFCHEYHEFSLILWLFSCKFVQFVADSGGAERNAKRRDAATNASTRWLGWE